MNILDSSGLTPLIYAVKNSSDECAFTLLANGASTEVYDENGKGPLHMVMTRPTNLFFPTASIRHVYKEMKSLQLCWLIMEQTYFERISLETLLFMLQLPETLWIRSNGY